MTALQRIGPTPERIDDRIIKRVIIYARLGYSAERLAELFGVSRGAADFLKQRHG